MHAMRAATKPASLRRVTLETTLKPFASMEPAHVEQVCAEMIRQWRPLLHMAEHGSMLLWVADGTEILTWNGRYDSEIEWARYIGLANEERFGISDPDDPKKARLYTEQPARVTYRDLQMVVRTFKRLAREQGFSMQVGATFDPGPEFVYSDFKYKLHGEINEAPIGGDFVSLRPDYKVVCCWSKLRGDAINYAGFPDGIPEGTSFGRFLGRQCQYFLADLEFDYIWFSNGFGFSFFPWTYLGANFDGNGFDRTDYREMTANVMSFWDDFKRECPDYRTEVRGTNFSTGIELAKDFVPLRELYAKKYVELPPPNSPWGALNRDFGLELAGYMSRIAVLPGETFPFRFYANDPWFWQNPWWDAYGREPYDIYCPMAVGRVRADGTIQNPGIIEILSIDTEKGELNEACPLEIIPHLARAVQDFPDRPGIMTWLYPFEENARLVAERQDKASLVFFDEWFVRNAMNQGLPLNTVISTTDFARMIERGEATLGDTVLFAAASLMAEERAKEIVRHVKTGGKVLLYGPVTDPELLDMLNLKLDDGIHGELRLHMAAISEDRLENPGSPLLLHDPLLSGGSVRETVALTDDPHTRAGAFVQRETQTRAYALSRSLPEWQGGAIAWVRGTVAFRKGTNSHLPVRQGPEYRDASILTRYMLAELGYALLQTRFDDSSAQYAGTMYAEQTKTMYCYVSRRDNAYLFSGYKPDSTATIRLRFPQGAPIVTGLSAVIEDGCSLYAMDTSYHRECRVFVKQSGSGIVACKEGHPIRTRKKDTARSIVITGLMDAEVTLLPPLDALRSKRVEVNHTHRERRYLELDYDPAEGFVRLSHITGTIEVTW
jgi:hypothetical protein